MANLPEVPRSQREVQRAHDLIVSVLMGDPDIALSDEDRIRLRGCANVLCWVLGHEHNKNFAAVLAAVELRLNVCGYGFPAATEPPNIPARN